MRREHQPPKILVFSKENSSFAKRKVEHIWIRRAPLKLRHRQDVMALGTKRPNNREIAHSSARNRMRGLYRVVNTVSCATVSAA